VLSAGARKAYLIDKPLAAAIGAKIPVADSFGNMIVDFGGGATEAAVIALGGVVAHKSVRIGGNKVDEAISQMIRKKYNLAVGEQTAEMIKIKLGSGVKLKRPETLEVNGRDVIDGLPKNVELNSDEVYEVIRPILDLMLSSIRDALKLTPPELVADIADRGIVMTGGVSELRGLSVLVTREIGVSAHVVLEPQLCVVKGLGMAIENLDIYRRALK
jgi:rod shape-determining protein MreB